MRIEKKLLLHICCAGCGAYVSQVLKEEGFEVVLYFYNPNIFPEEELKIRLGEVKKVAQEFGLEFIIGEHDHRVWLKKVKGLEFEPEKGKRCLVCYQDRLESTAKIAREKNFRYFASTLSVSPHKLAGEIIRIGNESASQNGLEFLDRDFKKKDGFKKATILSRELKIKRQDYCGCEFSIRAN
jgi:predicted adenine nucleotide alpha hydrolase (AANH) superfamily ATPase